jgi:acyl dehydratase
MESKITHTFTQSDFDRFAALTGDDNPIHVDPAFAARTRFGKTVAHGMFLYSHVCAALGTFFPGYLQVEQEMMFPNPTFAGEPVTFRLTVTGTDPGSGVVNVQTTVSRADGETGLQGRAGIMPPDRD